MIDPKEIEYDYKEIRKIALKTPLIRLHWLETSNRKVWAKLECNQITNSFKIRGAYNAIRKIESNIPIITNSAGNHGLGIAYILWNQGRKGKIFVPVNASEIKLRRLINFGVEVIPVGKDLYECGQNAIKIAKEINGAYISPYSNKDVILGQGSIAVEVLEQKDSFDQVLIPLGGGGLIVGAGTYFKYKNKNCKINAIHPKIFQRKFENNYEKDFSKAVYPTIADGLAVQHTKEDFTGNLIKNIVDRIDQISEDDIEMGIIALLNNEGILAEGAGAIGIAALLNDPEGKIYNGDILVIISGGNISTSNLMHALAIHTNDNKINRLLGFSSVKLPQEAIKYEKKFEVNKKNINNQIKENYDLNNEKAWNEIIDNLISDIDNLKIQIQEHIEYSKVENLDINNNAISHVLNNISSLENFVLIAKNEKDMWNKKYIYRIALQEYSFLRNSLEWCSASSNQSKRIMFFSPAENNENAVNYDRYGSLLLKTKEFNLQQSLGFDTEKVELLLTSSGQAAYTIVESFLIRYVFSEKPKVVSCPYIYFENLEQIQAIKNIDFIVSDSWELEKIINLVEKYNAEVIFADPLANLGTLHTIDFIKFAKLLEGYDWSKKWLIVDGTMISGGFNIFEIFNKPNHPHILYFESGSKYLQLGLDIQMAGIVVVEKVYLPILNTLRRNTGTIMYQTGVAKFPTYNRKQFLSRMLRLTKNSEIIYNNLNSLNQDKKRILLTFPKNWKELGWSHGGGIVAVTFVDQGLNNRPCLDYLISLVIEECKKKDIPFTKGVSFGFSAIRLSAASAMAQNRPPFLRFSIGEESKEEMELICLALKKSFQDFFKKYNI